MSTSTEHLTHEGWLRAVRAASLRHGRSTGAVPGDDCERLASYKLLYGLGLTPRGKALRGVTVYGAWKNGHAPDVDPVMEVCAAGESSVLQVACTTIHELGHALAGPGAGHSKEWKVACKALGLRRAKARGQTYYWADLAPDVREHLTSLAVTDGAPAFGGKLGATATFKVSGGGCKAGHGTRGGKSRGKGSGSRMRLYECDCAKPVKIRAATDDLRAHCDKCGAAFKQP